MIIEQHIVTWFGLNHHELKLNSIKYGSGLNKCQNIANNLILDNNFTDFPVYCVIIICVFS